MTNNSTSDPLFLQWEAEYEDYQDFLFWKSLHTSWGAHVLKYIHCLFNICILVVNVFTIVAIVKFEYLHNKPTNILILGLSAADACLGKVQTKILI